MNLPKYTPLKAGIIGCGNISDRYFQAGARFHDFSVIACADLQESRAREKALQYPGVVGMPVSQLLDSKAIDLAINLTVPGVHAEVAAMALEAGKHVYGEKPLALRTSDGAALLALADKQGLRVGSAPDTFLGAGMQTARKLIDDGWIGRPVAATAFMQCHGHEHWHPDPEFYYLQGGGPLFDMGPYYLTALIHLLGPVKRVCGLTSQAFPERIITSEAKYGTVVHVEVPTHVAGTLEFVQGAIVTLVTSFDVWRHSMPHLEVHGTTGSLHLPDPNTFGGELLLSRAGGETWEHLPHSHGYPTEARGIGVADMAAAIQRKEPHRASGALAYHVLEIMEALHTSADQGQHISIRSCPPRPDALDMDLRDGCVRT
ncbi:MAG: Gfo/Idh/MocA family oxidoreductase [Candidatus Hydrogenedentes bacterium]|nr:Gfo/Idh/MocA family oxidoreductase [Candidatus Hydrogenedentota bacterium]